MSYREITVDGKTYEYVVGKQYIKIKGVGVFPREMVGAEVDRKRNKYIISPSIVTNLIRGVCESGKKLYRCEHTVTAKWTWNPYAIEILGKHIKMIDCPICVERVAGDI